jgi:hypothetical protein
VKDPTIPLIEKHLTDLYIDVQVQLERGTGTRPVLWMLVQQRRKAAEAVSAMFKLDLNKEGVIADLKHLQNEVLLYEDMVELCQELLQRGREADRELIEQEREEIADLMTPQDAQRAGIEQTPEDN